MDGTIPLTVSGDTVSRSFTTSRRGFIAATGGAVTAAAGQGISAAPAWDPRFPQYPFTLGTASGDPAPGVRSGRPGAERL